MIMSSRINFAPSLDFSGTIAAGQTPTIFLDGGPTFEEFTLVTNMPASSLLFIVEVDGDTRVKIRGQQMLDRETYDGRASTAGHFVFSFADNISRIIEGEAFTALTTRPDQRIKLSVEIADGDVTLSPTLALLAETSPYRPTEFVLRCIPEQVPITKIGENSFNAFRRASRLAIGIVPHLGIRRFFAYGPVTKLAAEQDGRSIFGKRNLEKASNDARLLRNGKTVPTSSTCYVYDPIVKGNVIRDMLDTFSREFLRFVFTTSAATDLEVLTEYVEDVRQFKAA